MNKHLLETLSQMVTAGEKGDYVKYMEGLEDIHKKASGYTDKLVKLADHSNADSGAKLAELLNDFYDEYGSRPDGIEGMVDAVIGRIWMEACDYLDVDPKGDVGDDLHEKLLANFSISHEGGRQRQKHG